jgi:hypothetical protein
LEGLGSQWHDLVNKVEGKLNIICFTTEADAGYKKELAQIERLTVFLSNVESDS